MAMTDKLQSMVEKQSSWAEKIMADVRTCMCVHKLLTVMSI